MTLVRPTVRLLALLVGLVAVGCVGGCKRKSATSQQAPSQSDPPAAIRPLLWSVEKDGTTSYLFGTMHQGVDPARLPTLVWDRLDASRAAAIEADLSTAASLPVLRTDGSSLRDDLGPEYWHKLEDVLGIELASRLAAFKPVIPGTLIAQRGLPDTPAIDSAIEARARERGKPITYLETLDSQFAILERMFDVRALEDMLDDIPGIEQQSAAMIEAYVAGDDARVLAINDRERARWIARGRTAAEFDANAEDVLYRRNASWIAGIEKLHADGGAFIAVGALHLVGPRSVVNLLTLRGYQVKRVLPDGTDGR